MAQDETKFKDPSEHLQEQEWVFVNREWVYTPLEPIDNITPMPLEKPTSTQNDYLGHDSTGNDSILGQPLELTGPLHAISETDPIAPSDTTETLETLEVDRSWVKDPIYLDRGRAPVSEEPSLRSIVDNNDFVIPDQDFWLADSGDREPYDPQSYQLPTQNLNKPVSNDRGDLDGLLNVESEMMDSTSSQQHDISDELPLI